ncbi:MAG: hypothetical protein JWO82_3507 [Akkermansiaceae bacterium]|nr:hypothetical protein [Akkermansiaceae bacterium]
MAISYPRITYGITAKGIPSRTAAAGEVQLGTINTLDVATAANVLYSLTITGITNAAAPVLNINSGTVTENGTTSTDESVTFEGKAVALTGNVRAVLVERIDNGFTRVITVTGASGNVWKIPGSGFALVGNGNAVVAGVADATLTLAMPDASEPGSVRITVLGY